MRTLVQKTKKFITSEENQFRYSTALKVTLFVLISALFLVSIMTLLLKVNLNFFQAISILAEDDAKKIYKEILITKVGFFLFIIVIWSAITFLLGIAISEMMVAPFKKLAIYCSEKVQNKNSFYDSGLFSNLKLMTRFSEVFFQYIDICDNEGKLVKANIPEVYTKIHKPLFEKTYFFSAITGFFILSSVNLGLFKLFFLEMYSQSVNIALEKINNSSISTQFILKQKILYDDIMFITIVFMLISFLALSMNLYNKISGVNFAIFSTMRTFMKGNYKARVHLIGFSYLRPYCRVINKYLDQIEKKFDNSKHKKTIKKVV